MKKRISSIICSLVLSFMFFGTVYASDTIIGAGDFTWTKGTDEITPGGLRTEGWGDGEHSVMNVAYTSSDTYKAYCDVLPDGMFRVLYYLPKNKEGNDTGRSARILDTDVSITDKNGSYDILSVKDYIYDSGYKDLGVYEFSAGSKITVSVNDDNKVIKGQWEPMFTFSHIKLEPVTEEHSDLLSAVNIALSAEDIKTAVLNYGTDFVDNDALFSMDSVYEKVYESRPASGFSSSYHFKRVFEDCVFSKLTKVTIPASSFIWQTNESTAQSSGFRINWAPIELNHKSDSNIAVATFKFVNTEHIKKLELKLNRDIGSDKTENNVVITKYSGDRYEKSSTAEKILDKGMNSVKFTELDTPKKLMLSAKDITDEKLINAIAKNGYLSLYMKGDSLSYNDANCGSLKLSEECTIDVYYDLSYLGGEAKLSYYTESGNIIDENAVSVSGNKIVIMQKDGKAFDDFDFLDYITVTADGEGLASDEYTVKKIDSKTLSVEISGGLSYDTEYAVKSGKYVKFENDDLSYEFAAKFKTEKYPVEFSGVTLTEGGQKIESPDDAKGKKVSVSAEIKNNSLPSFDAVLVVNLCEQTADGTKMIKSLLSKGSVTKDAPLSLNGSFDVPDKSDADYFITAYVFDGFKTLNFVKMYNRDSYQKID